MSEPWVGFDLDGTLAEYNGWHGVMHIGAPVERMVAVVKAHLSAGIECKIVTARVAGRSPYEAGTRALAREVIQKWLVEEAGLPKLDVTSEKDYYMVRLYDDLAVSVQRNTGLILSVIEQPLEVT